MNKDLLILFSFIFPLSFLYGQANFELDPGVKRDKIKFELIHNLIIVPVELNGLQLSFLLDTGVNTTILFGLNDQGFVDFPNAEKVRLRGLGNDTYIEALKSEHNKMRVGKSSANDLTLFQVLGRDINFSPRLGFPVHGILGGDFFKDFIVEINYKREFIKLYPLGQEPKKVKRYDPVPLVFFKNKPYLNVWLEMGEGTDVRSTLLIDSGLADALWLFEDGKKISIPQTSYADFIGLGLVGDIFGKRSKISSMTISDYELNEVLTSYPDTSSFGGLELYVARNGSVGGEILRRFHLIFNYRELKLYMRKNNDFTDEFSTNMSGITVEHSGFVIIEDFARIPDFSSDIGRRRTELVAEKTNKTFQLKPEYRIARIRVNSPAEIAGLRTGDIVVSINSKPTHKMDLEEIVQILSSKEGKRIKMKVLRNEKEMSCVFHLERPL